MIVGNIENGLEHGFVEHCLNYVLIIDPKCFTVKHAETLLFGKTFFRLATLFCAV